MHKHPGTRLVHSSVVSESQDWKQPNFRPQETIYANDGTDLRQIFTAPLLKRVSDLDGARCSLGTRGERAGRGIVQSAIPLKMPWSLQSAETEPSGL